jgi:hypothetical protein
MISAVATGVEDEPVLGGLGGDLTDQLKHLVAVPGDRSGLDVDVAGWAARVVGGEEHTALEHQFVGVRGLGEPDEEAFECVKLVQPSVGRCCRRARFCRSR